MPKQPPSTEPRSAPSSDANDRAALGTAAPELPVINLPKGGGAVRGIGEKFAANPVTGTGSVTVPITTSPGRSGFGPQLSLSYDPGAGNGPFGFGWSLSVPSSHARPTREYPAILMRKSLTSSSCRAPRTSCRSTRQGSPDEPVIGYHVRRYRPRIEGLFARIERWSKLGDPTDVHRRSISKDNILTIYGLDADSRIASIYGLPVHLRFGRH